MRILEESAVLRRTKENEVILVIKPIHVYLPFPYVRAISDVNTPARNF